MASDMVFVPGMFSVGSVVYKDLVGQLQTQSPSTGLHVVDLPSVDGIATKANLEPNGLEADIRAIRAEILGLVGAGKSVLVVAHSYGGTPALYACEGLWLSKRKSEGKAGGVLKVALISSSLSLPGKTIAGDRDDWKKAHGQIEDGTPPMEQHGKELFIIPTGFEKLWMNDLPETEYKVVRASLRPSPLSTAMTPTPEAEVKVWNIEYLITTKKDLAMPKDFQKYLADRAKAAGATVSCKELEAAHFPQVSRKEDVADWLISASNA